MCGVKKIFLVCVISLLSVHVFSLTKGSQTVVSVEPFVAFPASDSDNTMMTFGFFKNGFSLQDATTTCTFESVFPVSGDMALHGGRLYLESDLVLNNVTNLNSLGFIQGNNHIFDLSESVTGIPAWDDTVFHNTKLFLTTDLQVSGTIKFLGNCIVDGRRNRIIFNPDGHLIIGSGSSLTLKNIELDGITGDKIFCIDDSGQLVLDEMRWVQDSDYSFTNGSITFVNKVNFVGPYYTFAYQSAMTSTIAKHSIMYLEQKFTLSYDPPVARKDLLVFQDHTSILYLDGATLHVTHTGLQLTRGSIFVDQNVVLHAESKIDSLTGVVTPGCIELGNSNGVEDMVCNILRGSMLEVTGGQLGYSNVDPLSWEMGESAAALKMNAGTKLMLKESLDLGKGLLCLHTQAVMTKASGKQLTGSAHIFK